MSAHEIAETAVLWAAVAAEIAIFAYVIGASIKYVVPWDELRANRDIRRRLAGRVAAHREAIRRMSAQASHQPRRYRAPWARDLADAISRDVVRLLGLCLASVGAVERNMGRWPRECAQIEADVASTLESIRKMLELRDARLPELVRERVALAREALAALSALRNEMAARIEAHHAAGVRVGYERRVITMLANAFAAHEASLKDDPDATIALLPKWRARIAEAVVTAEIRATVERRVAEVSESAPQRVTRIRGLVEKLAPAVLRLQPAAGPDSPLRKLIDLMSADLAVQQAQANLRVAQGIVALEGEDVGADGDSVRRLKHALLCAERAEMLLARFEDDLLVAAAAFEAASHSGPKRPN